MSEGLSAALARLEPDSGWEGVAHDARITPEFRVQLSTAISLKRIADTLAGLSGDGLHGLVMDLAYGAGTSFEAGKRRA